jgi:hypothetical protein
MTTTSSPPVCPGCDRSTAARRARGVIRSACLTPDCLIVDIGRALPRRPYKPARRIPDPSSGPSLLLDIEPFHPDSRPTKNDGAMEATLYHKSNARI